MREHLAQSGPKHSIFFQTAQILLCGSLLRFVGFLVPSVLCFLELWLKLAVCKTLGMAQRSSLTSPSTVTIDHSSLSYLSLALA